MIQHVQLALLQSQGFALIQLVLMPALLAVSVWSDVGFESDWMCAL